MHIPRRATTAAAAATALACAVSLAPTAHAQSVTATQGERIRIGESALCTLSFVDYKLNPPAAYTAAHCGSRFDPVYVEGPNGWALAGTLYPSDGYNAPDTGNDWAMIRLHRATSPGGNPLSGNNRVRPDELVPGDRLCFRGGATTRTDCGRFIGRIGGNVYWENTGAKQGDSGSPVWVEGKGYVGVLAGHSIVTSRSGEFTVLRASVPDDNYPQVTAEQEKRLIAEYYGDEVNRVVPVVRPTPVTEPEPDNPQQADGSSDVRTVTLAVLAVLGVLAFAAPLVMHQLGVTLAP